VGGSEVDKGLRKIKRNRKFLSLHIVVKISVEKPTCVLYGETDIYFIPTFSLTQLNYGLNAADIQLVLFLGIQTSDLGISDHTKICPVFSLTT